MVSSLMTIHFDMVISFLLQRTQPGKDGARTEWVRESPRNGRNPRRKKQDPRRRKINLADKGRGAGGEGRLDVNGSGDQVRERRRRNGQAAGAGTFSAAPKGDGFSPARQPTGRLQRSSVDNLRPASRSSATLLFRRGDDFKSLLTLGLGVS